MLVEDSWLAGFLGYPAFHLPIDDVHAFKLRQLPQGRAFIDVKIPVDEIALLEHVQALGFRLIDTNIQFFRPAEPFKRGIGAIRFAVPEDEPAVRKIAAEIFVYDRFHADPNIPDGRSAIIKANWAGNFFHAQRGDWMVVAERKGRVVGFNQILKRDEETVVIDLIGVDKNSQRRGLAASMMAFSATACLDHPTNMIVGTQIANIASLAVYERLGFTVSSATYVLHLHSGLSE